ncbi:MAG: Rrf2 family transcriptional regulator [Chloroflexi bacterium]|nr:Rrf2 family transcriptional regulator [Chloroflexota bacterium]
MRLSTRSRYAVRALIDLAMHLGEGPVLVREIADREDISVRYLEQLLLPLKAAGLVRATRGANGGFTLAKDPAEVNLREIIKIMEGSTAFTECVDSAEVCSRSDTCILRSSWIEVTDAANKVMEKTSLQVIVDRQNLKSK